MSAMHTIATSTAAHRSFVPRPCLLLVPRHLSVVLEQLSSSPQVQPHALSRDLIGELERLLVLLVSLSVQPSLGVRVGWHLMFADGFDHALVLPSGPGRKTVVLRRRGLLDAESLFKMFEALGEVARVLDQARGRPGAAEAESTYGVDLDRKYAEDELVDDFAHLGASVLDQELLAVELTEETAGLGSDIGEAEILDRRRCRIDDARSAPSAWSSRPLCAHTPRRYSLTARAIGR